MKSILQHFRKTESRPEPPAAVAAPPPLPDDLPTGTETVLVAEDEEIIRECISATLTQLGYRVIDVADGQEGLLHFQNASVNRIDLLLTDIVMPKLSGKELAHCVSTLSPETKIIFCSGYPEKLANQNGMISPSIPFLQKPVSSRSLAFKIREVLNAGKECKEASPHY